MRPATGNAMIQHPAFSVEPWAVRETALHLDVLAQTESVFALANGHIGLRGNLDEEEPSGLPGTYLNGFYELRPLPYAEAGYGDPGSGQALINVINGKVIRLQVDDEPFDVRYGELRAHERRLDLRAGVLERRADWISPTRRPVRVSCAAADAAARYPGAPLRSASARGRHPPGMTPLRRC
jgi:alpha,alpha-trehalose phosphorylase